MHFLIVQDYKENRRKCTLTALESRTDFTFRRLEHPSRSAEKVEVGPGILLEIDAPPLSRGDAQLVAAGSLVIVDSTWARVPKVLGRLRVTEGACLQRRRIPDGFLTAYPRMSKLHSDPPDGLASVEAIFAATAILGEPLPDLLGHYHWAREFLWRNQEILRKLSEESIPPSLVT